MVIELPDSWIREYLDTEASFKEFKEFMSLSGPTIEKAEKVRDDVIYTIEITPNRPDLLSVVGIAREAAAVLPRYKKKSELVHIPQEKETDHIKPADDLSLKFNVSDPNLVPHYMTLVLKDVDIKPSPSFIKERLEKSGVRSLNNIVDISNYVMLETGQPMHIFDYDTIKGSAMNLRESKPGEKVTTLDGEERDLPEGTIIIEDEEKIIDLCGIMGGENTEVREDTEAVVLFVQIYDPSKIRKTFRQLNLVTDAALRFEKGLDPEMVEVAFNRAYDLLLKHANAKPASKVENVKLKEYKPKVVEVTLSQIQEYLDERISIEEAAGFLKSLGFKTEIDEPSYSPPLISAKVPSYRTGDIEIEEDLIEEIARLYGYQNLKNTIPDSPPPVETKDKRFYWEDKMKDILKFSGFFEVYNFSFVSKSQIKNTLESPNDAVRVKNPLNKDLEYLRSNLFANLLTNVKDNAGLQSNLKIFELERVFLPTNGTKLPEERIHLSALIFSEERDDKNFYRLKGAVENIMEELNIESYNIKPFKNEKGFWQKGRTAKITAGQGGKIIGRVGEVSSKVLKNFGIEGEIYGLDLEVDSLLEFASDLHEYKNVIEHPPIIEDLSMIIDEKTTYGAVRDQILNSLRTYDGLSLNPSTVELIDVFDEEEKVGKNKKSLTLRIFYQQRKEPLSTKQIEPVRETIIKDLEKGLKAEVRKA